MLAAGSSRARAEEAAVTCQAEGCRLGQIVLGSVWAKMYGVLGFFCLFCFDVGLRLCCGVRFHSSGSCSQLPGDLLVALSWEKLSVDRCETPVSTWENVHQPSLLALSLCRVRLDIPVWLFFSVFSSHQWARLDWNSAPCPPYLFILLLTNTCGGLLSTIHRSWAGDTAESRTKFLFPWHLYEEAKDRSQKSK